MVNVMTGARVVLILAALSPFCFAAIVLIGAVRHMRSRGEEAGTPKMNCGCPKDSRPRYGCMYCDDWRCYEHVKQHDSVACRDREHLALARAAGVTVPPLDGSHESLPEDKETYEAFWSLAKTIGIEVKQ